MITSIPRAEVQRLVQAGELNIKSVTHYDICQDRKAGITRAEVAKKYRITERQVTNITNCKCPE